MIAPAPRDWGTLTHAWHPGAPTRAASSRANPCAHGRTAGPRKKNGPPESRSDGPFRSNAARRYAALATPADASSSSPQAPLGMGRKSWKRIAAAQSTATAVQMLKTPVAAR